MLNRNLTALLCVAAGVATSSVVAGEPGVAAVVGGKKITTAELDERALGGNMKLAQTLYDARKKVLDDLIMERLLDAEAKEKGVPVAKLLAEKIAAKAAPVTDEEVSGWFESNKARLRNRTLEQVSGQIKGMLERQRKDAARAEVMAELKKGAGVTVHLDAPRATVKVAQNDPYKGGKDAKVTIVEFSEFQ